MLLLQCTVHAPYRYEFREDDESTDFHPLLETDEGSLKGQFHEIVEIYG